MQKGHTTFNMKLCTKKFNKFKSSFSDEEISISSKPEHNYLQLWVIYKLQKK